MFGSGVVDFIGKSELLNEFSSIRTKVRVLLIEFFDIFEDIGEDLRRIHALEFRVFNEFGLRDPEK